MMQDDKLPDGVVLFMQNLSQNSLGCEYCYFFKSEKKCPKEWDKKRGVFTLSCTYNRNVYFKELGEENAK